MINKTLLDLKLGDCLEKLKEIPDASVNLVVTSPPYSDRRKDKYSSVSSSKYIEWFIPIAKEIKRVLTPDGSFLLNIKPHCEKGERQLYVFELVIALKKEVGFYFVDEYVWYKSALPMKWSNRLRDAWEPFFHFSLGKNYINYENISLKSQSAFINKRGYSCFNDQTGNVGGYHSITDQGEGVTIADNILYFPSSLLVKDKYNHPAKFPVELADFLIKAFCPEKGVVLDPFIGSGTTAVASLLLDRKCVGIDIEEKYYQMTLDRINEFKYPAEKKIPKNIFIYTE